MSYISTLGLCALPPSAAVYGLTNASELGHIPSTQFISWPPAEEQNNNKSQFIMGWQHTLKKKYHITLVLGGKPLYKHVCHVPSHGCVHPCVTLHLGVKGRVIKKLVEIQHLQGSVSLKAFDCGGLCVIDYT